MTAETRAMTSLPPAVEETPVTGWRKWPNGSPRVVCFFEGCIPLMCWRGPSGRVEMLGRLDPPFIVHEHDGSETHETYCRCRLNELGLHRLFLVPADADLFRAFDDVMREDARLAASPSREGAGPDEDDPWGDVWDALDRLVPAYPEDEDDMGEIRRIVSQRQDARVAIRLTSEEQREDGPAGG